MIYRKPIARTRGDSTISGYSLSEVTEQNQIVLLTYAKESLRLSVSSQLQIAI